MATYYVHVRTKNPQTFVEEVVEVEADTPERAEELALEGDGYQVKINIELGESSFEEVTSTVDMTDSDI